VDIVPKTNFPDIRKVCYIRASTGTILLVPRSNKEVRLYVPVESGSALSNPKNLTFERIIDAARKIILPYTLEVGSCSWWSAYRVGQRVGDRFCVQDRFFLAGDAVRKFTLSSSSLIKQHGQLRLKLFRHSLAQSWPRHEHKHSRCF
jgi:phenol 2-monooxygenase (NADPH)